MTWTEANTKAYELWARWVSNRPAVGINGYIRQTMDHNEYQAYDLDRIHASMLQEARWHATGRSAASPALISEVKGELITLGKVRKALQDSAIAKASQAK
jgi:hypothetical protein